MGLVLSGAATKVTLSAVDDATLIDDLETALINAGWTLIGGFSCVATFYSNPTAGQQVNFGRNYTFVTSGGDDDQNVLIGANLAATLAQLCSNINHVVSAGPPPVYSNGNCICLGNTATTLVVGLRGSAKAFYPTTTGPTVDFIPSIVFGGDALVSAADQNGKRFGLLLGSAADKDNGALGDRADVIVYPVCYEWAKGEGIAASIVARHGKAPILRTNTGESLVAIVTPWGFSIMKTGDSSTKGFAMQFFSPYQNPDLKIAGHVPDSISRANPAVVTQTGACKSIATGGLGYATGHTVYVGQTALKSALGRHTITVIDDDHYSLDSVDTSSDPGYDSAIVANDTLGELAQCHLFLSDTVYANAASLNQSFRTKLGLRNDSDNQMFVTANGTFWTSTTNGNGSPTLAQITYASDAGTTQSAGGVRFRNGRAPNIEPMIAWGDTPTTQRSVVGTLPDCFISGWPLTVDRTYPDIPVFTALGSNKKGHNFTSNWNGDSSGPQMPGSLVLIYDNG